MVVHVSRLGPTNESMCSANRLYSRNSEGVSAGSFSGTASVALFSAEGGIFVVLEASSIVAGLRCSLGGDMFV